MSTPTNTKLYEEVKKEIYAKYPKHSAYRSGLLVQEYKNDLRKVMPRVPHIKVKRKRMRD